MEWNKANGKEATPERISETVDTVKDLLVAHFVSNQAVFAKAERLIDVLGKEDWDNPVWQDAVKDATEELRGYMSYMG